MFKIALLSAALDTGLFGSFAELGRLNAQQL